MGMRHGLSSWGCVLFAVVALVASSCGYFYKVKKQEPVDAAAIKSASTFKWRPISFAEIERLADYYESDEDWQTDIRDVQKEYLEVVTERVAEAGLAAKVSTVGLQAAVTEGVIIVPVVKRIKQDYSVVGGGYDYLYVDLLFQDAASQKTLFTGQVECTSSTFFGPTGWRASSIDGRLALASWNTIAPIISVIKSQKIQPLEQ